MNFFSLIPDPEGEIFLKNPGYLFTKTFSETLSYLKKLFIWIFMVF
jgi:hypothetical protein